MLARDTAPPRSESSRERTFPERGSFQYATGEGVGTLPTILRLVADVNLGRGLRGRHAAQKPEVDTPAGRHSNTFCRARSSWI
jgi:hypothetical protein